jgi:hypothetical protein
VLAAETAAESAVAAGIAAAAVMSRTAGLGAVLLSMRRTCFASRVLRRRRWRGSRLRLTARRLHALIVPTW